MPERVTAVERERLLRFEVLHTPPTMRELNPFGEVEAGHLNGFFECLEGEFVLEALPGGHTRVVGTTRYRHRFRPAAYWSVWTDYIVRCVHSRVLTEIARSCESQEASPAR
jgi:hypothetical protein